MKALDRLEIRSAVGAAQARIDAAIKSHFDDPKRQAERDRLHKAWRSAQDAAQVAQRAYESFVKADLKRNIDPADVKLIRDARRKNPDLRTWPDHPDEAIMCCSATGLAMFDGDKVFGEPEYGGGVLCAAVTLNLPPVITGDPVK